MTLTRAEDITKNLYVFNLRCTVRLRRFPSSARSQEVAHFLTTNLRVLDHRWIREIQMQRVTPIVEKLIEIQAPNLLPVLRLHGSENPFTISREPSVFNTFSRK